MIAKLPAPRNSGGLDGTPRATHTGDETMIRVFPGRSFFVAEYSAAHGLLRVSSPKSGDEPFVDLMFRGVAYFELPASLAPGLEVLEPQPHDLAFVNSRLPAPPPAQNVFILACAGRRHRVVAEELKVAESMGALSESPFPPTDLTSGGPASILRGGER